MTNTKFVFTETELFPQCHGSTLAQLSNGDILVSWFGGTREAHPDTAIYGSILNNDSQEWNEPFLMFKINDTPHWNPVLMIAADGSIQIWFKTGDHPWSWETWHSTSVDGKSWSDPSLLKDQVLISGQSRGPVRNKPIILSDGRWLAPSSHEEKKYRLRPKAPGQLVPYQCLPHNETSYYSGYYVWNSFADISEDKGETWQKTDYIEHPELQKEGGIIQPSAWESSPGHIHMMLRSTWGKIYRTDSEDGGKTWTRAYSTSLPNNNSGIEVLNLGDGVLALVYNPVSGNWASRNALAVSFSPDNGKTWQGEILLENTIRGEYSYPSAIVTDKGLVITYTWRRVNICCVTLDVNKKSILKGKISASNEMVNLDLEEDMPQKLINRIAYRKTLSKQARRERVFKMVENNKTYEKVETSGEEG